MDIEKITKKTIDTDILQAFDSTQMQSANAAREAEKIQAGLAGKGIEGEFDVTQFSAKSDKQNGPSKEQTAFVESVKKELEKGTLYPSNLEKFIEENVQDEALKSTIKTDMSIIAKAEPKDYPKIYENTNDDLMKAIVNIYMNYETVMAEADMLAAVAKIEKDGLTANYSEKLAKLKEEFKTEGNPYREYALKQYEEALMPTEMEVRLISTLRKMENEGKLDDISAGAFGRRYSTDDIRKAVVAEAGGDKEFDKFVKKYGEDYIDVVMQHRAIAKRREELAHVTQKEMDDLSDGLKNSTQKLIANYMELHKTEGEDGKVTYDLSGISDAIASKIGADNIATVTGNLDSEMRYIRHALSEELGVSADEITEKQAKDLIEFCGYDWESRSHRVKLFDAGKALVQGAGAGLAGGAVAAPSSVDILVTVTNLNINTANIYNELGVLIDTHTEQSQGNAFSRLISQPVPLDLLSSVAVGAAVGLASSVLYDAIIGNPIEFEKACFNLLDTIDNPHIKNKNEYIKYLKSLPDGEKEYAAVKNIFDLFPAKPDGSWDYEGFKLLLNDMAGKGSPLVCREILAGGVYADPQKPVPAKPTAYAAEETKKTEDKVEYITTPPSSEADPEKDIRFTKYVKNSSWLHIVDNVYGCDETTLAELFGGKSRATRVLKIVQAITNEDYSYENIKKLLDMSYGKGLEKLTVEQDGFDYNEYLKFLRANTMPSELKLPKEIAGVKRCDLSDERVLIAKKATTTGTSNNIKGTPRYHETPGGTKPVVTVQGKTEEKYYFKESGSETKTYDKKEDRDAESAKWQKDNPTGTFEDYGTEIDKFNEAVEKEKEKAEKEKAEKEN